MHKHGCRVGQGGGNLQVDFLLSMEPHSGLGMGLHLTTNEVMTWAKPRAHHLAAQPTEPPRDPGGFLRQGLGLTYLIFPYWSRGSLQGDSNMQPVSRTTENLKNISNISCMVQLLVSEVQLRSRLISILTATGNTGCHIPQLIANSEPPQPVSPIRTCIAATYAISSSGGS